MDLLERVLTPGEKLRSFFRANLDRVGAGILAITDRRLVWVPETGAEVSIETGDMVWVARSGMFIRISLRQGSFKFSLGTDAAATSATSFLLACVQAPGQDGKVGKATEHPKADASEDVDIPAPTVE